MPIVTGVGERPDLTLQREGQVLWSLLSHANYEEFGLHLDSGRKPFKY